MTLTGLPPRTGGWVSRPVKHFMRRVPGAGFPLEEQGIDGLPLPFYKVSALGMAEPDGYIRQVNDTVDLATARRLGAQVIPAGSAVMAKIGAAALLGRVRQVSMDACLDNNMVGFVATKERMINRFAFYALQQLDVKYFMNPSTLPFVDERRLLDATIPVPELAEQWVVADFLDRETAQVDAMIEAQRNLVVALGDRRTAVIHGSVTGGLATSVPTRASGLPWLGQVPDHWQVGNIRRFASMKTGHTPSRQVTEYWVDCEIPWFTLADVHQLRSGRSLYLGETTEQISELGLANSAAELLPAGTVVLSRTASVGFSGIMPRPMATSQDFWNWVCGPGVLPEYLLYVFRAMRQEWQALRMGSTHQTIYQGDAAGIRIPVPPKSEQIDIVERIQPQLGRMDAMIDAANESIALMQERRSALISAAVTGRIDPRTGREYPQEDL